jgi:hypothetical protein
MVVVALVLVAVALGSGLVLTMYIQPTQTIYWIYSAKFLCSTNNDTSHPNPNGVAPGVYETDINIHNHKRLSFGGPPVNVTKDVVVALNESYPTTSPVPLGTGHESLFGQRAFRIDCVEILSTLASQCPTLNSQPYCPWVRGIHGPATGFVEIIVTTTGTPTAPPPPLDVVAVYTTADLVCHTGIPCHPGNATNLEVVHVPYEQFYP